MSSNSSSGAALTAMQDWMKQLGCAGIEHSESGWKNMELCLTDSKETTIAAQGTYPLHKFQAGPNSY
jgi:hypothetical protein